MNEALRLLTERLRDESGGSPECERLLTTDDLDELAGVLAEPGRPLWAREAAAFRLGAAGDRRAFEGLCCCSTTVIRNAARPPRTPWPGSATRAPPGPRPPSPRTNSESPTQSTPSACSSSCGPRGRTALIHHVAAQTAAARSLPQGGARLCGGARGARRQTRRARAQRGSGAPGARGGGRTRAGAPSRAPLSSQEVRSFTYRTSGTATPSTSKGSSAPSARNPARS